MSYLSFPRINFQGVFKTNPCTSNNDDVMVAVDPINVTLKPPLDAMTDDEARAWLKEPVIKVGNNNEQTLFLKSGWNFYGDFGTSFQNATVTSVGGPAGTNQTDALVGEPVYLLGSGGYGPPFLVDMDETGLITTQLYIGGFQIGGQAIRCKALSDTRGYETWLSLQRVLGPYGGEQNFVGIGCVWQATFPKESLQFPAAGGSEILRALQEGAMAGQGIVVRFTIYEVQPQTDGLTLAKEFAAGQGPQNPAFGYMIGSIGVWQEGELTSEPSGRLLQIPPGQLPPNMKISYQGGSGKIFLGNGVAMVHDDPPVVSVDLSNSLPKDGFRYPGGLDTPQKQADLGPVELAYIPDGGGEPLTIGSFDYGATDFERFGAFGGIVDVPYDPASRDAIGKGTLLVRGTADSALNASIPILQEVDVRVSTDDRATYLDPNGTCEVRLWVTQRGGPPTRDITLYPREYHDLIVRQTRDYRPDQTVGPAKERRLGFPDSVTVPAGTTGPVTVAVSAVSPGPASLAFQLSPDQNLSGVFPWTLAYYSNFRVYAADDYSSVIAAGPIPWDLVYKEVLRYYYILFPAMSLIIPLNSEEVLAQPANAQAVLDRTEDSMFFSTRFMPITRSMSPGRRELLRAWERQQLQGPRGGG